MKKIRIYSWLSVFLLMLFYVVVNHSYFGSTTEMIWALIIIVIFGGFFFINGIFATKGILQKTYRAIVPEVLLLVILFFLILFIINSSLWDTDTGSFRIFTEKSRPLMDGIQ